jgi:MFS family permease
MQQSGQAHETFTPGVIVRMPETDSFDLQQISDRSAPMHQIVSNPVESLRRWWVLATVVAAQFMFGVDAFVVNVAIPTIAVDLHASTAQIEAVIAVYLIGYGTLIVTGGRLGDIYGTKAVFITGVFGFTVASLWCGLAQSGTELIVARLAQGAMAALMVPQVLATLHLLFTDASRSRAFGIYGIVLGVSGAAGFVLGGLLVALDLAGLGWRTVFFVNVPLGVMPTVPRRAGTRLDVPGAIVLFIGLLCLLGPLLFGRDMHWWAWVWLAMAAGIAIIAEFVGLERMVARRGGMPLVDLALLSDRAFMRGLVAVFFFFFANLSFYLVVTIFMQKELRLPPLQGGLVFLPMALIFIAGSRHSGARAKHRGTLVLIEGCIAQLGGLAALVDGCAGCRALRAGVGDGAYTVWLRSGRSDGAVVVRGAFEREAVERGWRIGDVWYHRTDRQRVRCRGDRRGVLRHRGSRRLGTRGVTYIMRILGCRSLFAPHSCHGCGGRR